MSTDLNSNAAKIADETVPQYRAKGASYACSGQVARRWTAAYEAALAALCTSTIEVPKAWSSVLAERARQTRIEGWSAEHDDLHTSGELAGAAACYAAYRSNLDPVTVMGADLIETMWPWCPSWWKPTDRRRDLVKAGALILAEIERLDRAAKAGALTDRQLRDQITGGDR